MQVSENTVRVWDPLVRIGHWTLVTAFFIAYFTEDDLLTVHAWAGYVVGAVVLVRILWGFIGTKHARFSDFFFSPTTTLSYLWDLTRARAKHYLGHNPAGAAMIFALLIMLAGTVYSGLVLYAIEEDAGPLADWAAVNDPIPRLPDLIPSAHANGDGDEDAAEDFWEDVHEVFADLTLLLVGLHVAGVLLSSFMHKENLIKGMITGRKAGP